MESEPEKKDRAEKIGFKALLVLLGLGFILVTALLAIALHLTVKDATASWTGSHSGVASRFC